MPTYADLETEERSRRHGEVARALEAKWLETGATGSDLSLLNAHSDHGLTYGAINAWGCANAQIENVSVGTAGVVTGSDYVSPTLLGTGLSIGVMLPAPGNNDLVYVTNLSIQGGYTYAIFLNTAPPSDALKRVTGQQDEEMRLGKREIFVHYPTGMGRSKLRIPAAKAGTARNMNTVAKLVELATKS